MKDSPAVSISQMLQCIKGNSSKCINDKKHTKMHFSWQTVYGAFTVSQSNADVVINYIKHQEEHHKKQTFKEELIVLLDKHKIEYNEKYLWD